VHRPLCRYRPADRDSRPTGAPPGAAAGSPRDILGVGICDAAGVGDKLKVSLIAMLVLYAIGLAVLSGVSYWWAR